MAYYFPHDENARSDEKILRLLRVKGMKGYGIFWALIEKLHERGGEILISNIPDIAYELREDEANIKSVINEFGLFEMRGLCFCNARALHNLSEREGKSKVGSKAAQARWRKYKLEHIENEEVNANALHMHSIGNAIREDKRKEDNTYHDFIQFIGLTTGKAFRGDKKSAGQYSSRLNEGYNFEQIKTAIVNCFADPYHKEHTHFLTPEFITRTDKLQKYLFAKTESPKEKIKEIRSSSIFTDNAAPPITYKG